MLAIENLTKCYGSVAALQGVSLSLERGEFFGLLGPNGAGKTTLMSLVAGIRPADSGEIRLNGAPLDHRRVEQRAQLGFVPQALALYDELSGEENLRLFGRLYGLRGALLRDRVEEGLVAAQLEERRRDKVSTYSGGMKRRLNIVAAILHRPPLLLCDEPTAGVDPQSRNAIFEFVQRLNADGMTIVYSTHYMEEATRLCSRIGIIDHGKLLALGTLDELLLQLPFAEQIRIARNEETAPHLPAFAHLGELVTMEDGFVLTPRADTRLSDLFGLAEKIGLANRHFQITRPSLESVFLHLTGKTLRDA
ncbi:MAG: linearmycin/streptolysin transport system ATP-binding protein [Verrucomicrobiota bacterium]|jgi:ABC-2 type transport system ATP-binding protein